MLRDDINGALKEAMKAGQARRVSTLRLINAAILERETRGAERATLNDAEIVEVMQKMVKQRQEALEIYEKAGRTELAAQEREEIDIIFAYLPKRMSDIEAAHAISALIKEIEAETLKEIEKAKWLEPEDLYYLGFHLAEHEGRQKQCGGRVLNLVLKRAGRGKLAQAAKSKLRGAGLD